MAQRVNLANRLQSDGSLDKKDSMRMGAQEVFLLNQCSACEAVANQAALALLDARRDGQFDDASDALQGLCSRDALWDKYGAVSSTRDSSPGDTNPEGGRDLIVGEGITLRVLGDGAAPARLRSRFIQYGGGGIIAVADWVKQSCIDHVEKSELGADKMYAAVAEAHARGLREAKGGAAQGKAPRSVSAQEEAIASLQAALCDGEYAVCDVYARTFSDKTGTGAALRKSQRASSPKQEL